MKYITPLFATVMMCTYMYAQDSIGIGTAAPDASAILDITSNTQGILIPRMDSNARKSIAHPAMGLMVYDSSTNVFWFFDGNVWTNNIEKKHAIGEHYGGGIIFFVDSIGEHGLIAAATDQSTGIRWYGGTYTNTMSVAKGVGAGKTNTALIIASQGYGDGSTYAARMCNELQVTDGNIIYGDWYLPSRYELNLLYLQKNVIGGFVDEYYWSSNEADYAYAWIQSFGNGYVDYDYEGGTSHYVRAVRSF